MAGGGVGYVAGTATAVVSSSDQLEHNPAISPDAKFMAYSVGPLMQRRIEVRPISGGRTIRLAEAVGGDHRSPRWSPDGSSILFVADSKLYTVPAFGGEPRLLYRQATSFPLSADWSPRGDAFVFVSNDTIWTRSVDGGATTHLASGGDISSPAWAPDGRYIAFVRGNSAYMQVPGNVSPSTIWVVPGQGGAPWPVTDSTGMHHSPVWSSDSRSIFFVSNLEGTRDVYRIRLSSDARRRGVPQRVTSGLHAATISLDASGTRLAYAVLFLRRNVWAVAIPPAGASSVGRPHQLTSGNQTVEGVHVSHDGRWLLFDSNASGNQDVYKLDLTDTTGTAQPIQLTRDPGDDFLARFSPNDREIVFYSVRTGTRDVFVMTAEGSDVQRVTDLAGHELYPDWSPDGSRVVWGVSGSGTSASIGIVDRAGVGWSPPRLISVPDCSARSMFPRWAPNGAWISVPCQTEGVALVSPDGAKRRIVRVPGVDVWYADWASDPNVVYVKARPSGQIWAVPLTSGSPRLVFSPSDPRLPVARQEFATDGRRLFFTLSSDESDIWVMELSKK